MPAAGTTAKSDEQRRRVIEAAVACFARKGFYGTTTHEIAEGAGISQPYLYRLFTDKQTLFVRAVEYVGALLTAALTPPAGTPPRRSRAAMRRFLDDAYASLTRDNDVLRFLMQANCAVDEPVIRAAVRACYAEQVTLVTELLGADAGAVRSWFGAGMLDNVVLVLGLEGLDEQWARTLTDR